PEGLRRLHELLELDALLRSERGLAEEIVVRKRVASLDSCRGVDRLAFAGRLNFSSAEQRKDEQPNDFEIPAEGFLCQLIGEISSACGVAVVGALFDTGQDFSQGAAFNAKDGLPFLVTQKPEATKHRRKALQVLRCEQSVDALLGVRWPRRRFLETIKNLWKHVAQDVCRTLAHIDRTIVWASVIATEADAACQACCLHEPAQLILMTPLTNFLFADQGRLVGRLGFAFLPRQHLFGSEEFDGFAVYGVIERYRPENTLPLLLTASAQF